jgi:hypothetical protein
MPHRSLRRHCSSGFLVLLAVLSGPLVYAQTAKVSGTIVVNATTIAPTAVSAVAYKAPNGQLISVLVSDKAADRKEFLERTKVGPGEPLVSGIFEGAWKSLHLEKALSGFVFTITSDRRIVSNEFLVGGDDAFSISPDDLVLELTSTAPRLTGRIRTKEPTVDLGSQKVGLDLTFDVPVGEPGK